MSGGFKKSIQPLFDLILKLCEKKFRIFYSNKSLLNKKVFLQPMVANDFSHYKLSGLKHFVLLSSN
jgi:hypothetical protein